MLDKARIGPSLKPWQTYSTSISTILACRQGLSGRSCEMNKHFSKTGIDLFNFPSEKSSEHIYVNPRVIRTKEIRTECARQFEYSSHAAFDRCKLARETDNARRFFRGLKYIYIYVLYWRITCISSPHSVGWHTHVLVERLNERQREREKEADTHTLGGWLRAVHTCCWCYWMSRGERDDWRRARARQLPLPVLLQSPSSSERGPKADITAYTAARLVVYRLERLGRATAASHNTSHEKSLERMLVHVECSRGLFFFYQYILQYRKVLDWLFSSMINNSYGWYFISINLKYCAFSCQGFQR